MSLTLMLKRINIIVDKVWKSIISITMHNVSKLEFPADLSTADSNDFDESTI